MTIQARKAHTRRVCYARAPTHTGTNALGMRFSERTLGVGSKRSPKAIGRRTEYLENVLPRPLMAAVLGPARGRMQRMVYNAVRTPRQHITC